MSWCVNVCCIGVTAEAILVCVPISVRWIHIHKSKPTCMQSDSRLMLASTATCRSWCIQLNVNVQKEAGLLRLQALDSVIALTHAN